MSWCLKLYRTLAIISPNTMSSIFWNTYYRINPKQLEHKQLERWNTGMNLVSNILWKTWYKSNPNNWGHWKPRLAWTNVSNVTEHLLWHCPRHGYYWQSQTTGDSENQVKTILMLKAVTVLLKEHYQLYIYRYRLLCGGRLYYVMWIWYGTKLDFSSL